MIASLSMYDMPHARSANDALWHGIRNALGTGPENLTRDGDPWDIWQSPDLFLSQTCGLPFRAHLHEKVQLVGTPDYGLPGCSPGHYNSVIVVRHDDPAQSLADLNGRSLAYNEALSQSGWAAVLAHFAAENLAFVTGPATGGHALSALTVIAQDADFAALDALTWRMLTEADPDLATQLRVLDHTTPTPGLPFITAQSQDAQAIAKGVRTAIQSLAPKHRDTLHLKGLVQIPAQDYLSLQIPRLP